MPGIRLDGFSGPVDCQVDVSQRLLHPPHLHIFLSLQLPPRHAASRAGNPAFLKRDWGVPSVSGVRVEPEVWELAFKRLQQRSL